MSEVEVRDVKHSEAIRFFQQKLLIPSRQWTDMIGPIHSKAFTVAGVTKSQLLKDLYTAIEGAIQEGTTLNEFRKEFDNIVKKHGWSYNGKRGWRTRVIFQTNKNNAYMAGRWEQIWRVREERPFLQYLTVDDSRVRQDHRPFHKRIYPVTSRFWKTHYPPNGWLCRCTVRSLSRDDMEDEGLRVSNAPLPEQVKTLDPETGEEKKGFPGVDHGWDYNVGQSWLAPDALLGRQLMELPSDLRNNAIKWYDSTKYDQPFKRMVNQVSYRMLTNRSATTGAQATAGFIKGPVLDKLFEKGIIPGSATISVKDRDIAHWLRNTKSDRGASIPLTTASEVPDIIKQPTAILFDNEDKALIYAKRLNDGRYAKFVVRLNFKTRLNHNERRFNEILNSIKSAGIVLASNLTLARYEVIMGNIEVQE